MSLYPDRNALHKYMAPPESCPECHGRGWYVEETEETRGDWIPDTREVYCSCPAGVERRRVEA